MTTLLDKFKFEVCNHLASTDPFTVKIIETIGGFAFSEIMDVLMKINLRYIGVRESKRIFTSGKFSSSHDYVYVDMRQESFTQFWCEVLIKIKGFTLIAEFRSENGNFIEKSKLKILPSALQRIIKKNEKSIQAIQDKISVYNDLLSGV